MSTPSQCDRAFFQALGFAQAVNNCSEEAAFNMQLLLPLSQGLLKMIQLGLIGLAPRTKDLMEWTTLIPFPTMQRNEHLTLTYFGTVTIYDLLLEAPGTTLIPFPTM
jgi:hypothetical protein